MFRREFEPKTFIIIWQNHEYYVDIQKMYICNHFTMCPNVYGKTSMHMLNQKEFVFLSFRYVLKRIYIFVRGESRYISRSFTNLGKLVMPIKSFRKTNKRVKHTTCSLFIISGNCFVSAWHLIELFYYSNCLRATEPCWWENWTD